MSESTRVGIENNRNPLTTNGIRVYRITYGSQKRIFLTYYFSHCLQRIIFMINFYQKYMTKNIVRKQRGKKSKKRRKKTAWGKKMVSKISIQRVKGFPNPKFLTFKKNSLLLVNAGNCQVLLSRDVIEHNFFLHFSGKCFRKRCQIWNFKPKF